MKTTISTAVAVALAGLTWIGPVAAADAPKKELTPQQQRMGDCSKEATGKKLSGDARKSFMKECLSGGGSTAAAPAPTSQQDKMKSCNKEAGEKKLTGDDRKKFMSTCLGG